MRSIPSLILLTMRENIPFLSFLVPVPSCDSGSIRPVGLRVRDHPRTGQPFGLSPLDLSLPDQLFPLVPLLPLFFPVLPLGRRIRVRASPPMTRLGDAPLNLILTLLIRRALSFSFSVVLFSTGLPVVGPIPPRTGGLATPREPTCTGDGPGRRRRSRPPGIPLTTPQTPISLLLGVGILGSGLTAP